MAVRRRNCVGGNWLTKWDKLKNPWYSHRLTHWKRVTCELHDSYFRLMTIKHAISKIKWAIEWALNYYITQSRQKSSGSCSYSWRRSYRRDLVGKATPGRRGPREPRWSLGTREVANKMQSRKLAPSRVDPRASGWASGERERHNVDGHKSGGQNITVYVWSPAPSHTQTLSNLFEPLQIKWEVHIFIKKSSCVFIIVSLWCCRWQYNKLRGWKMLWRRSLTRSHKRTSMGPSRSCWNSTRSALQP